MDNANNVIINVIDKELEYKIYILTHTTNIKKAFILHKDLIKDKLELTDEDMEYLNKLVVKHDTSKYSLEEFNPYRRHFYPTASESSMSQQVKDTFEEQFNIAWEHHYKNNEHHWEHWGEEDIPNVYIAEMMLDWIAMGMYNGNYAWQYYNDHRDDIHVTDNARIKIETFLNALREIEDVTKAEEETPAEDPMTEEDAITEETTIVEETKVEETVEVVHVAPEDITIE